jgi:AcrR family transcriptional regulator
MDFNSDEMIPLQPVDDAAGPKRAKRTDAIANRQLILDTAQHLFAEQGLSQVCMAAIAEAAQIGKGTLYRSFANKGELCLALLDEDMRNFQNKTLHRLREQATQPALDQLDHFLDNLTYFLDFHAPLLREVQRHGDLQSELQEGQTAPSLWLPWLRDTVRALLQQAEANQECQNLDIPYLTDAILAPLNADLFIFQREVQGFEIQRISRGIRRLVMRGCRL